MPDFVLPTLFKAIDKNDVDLVRVLLKKRPGLALKRGARGTTALMEAAREGRIDCVEALIPLSDPLAVDRDARSALMLAALRGHDDCLRALLPVSDPFAVDENVRSALDLAELYHEHEVAAILRALTRATGSPRGNEAP